MSADAPVYLDYAATTPVDPRVAAAMGECLTREGVFGNASSTHHYGRKHAHARSLLAAARRRLIRAPAPQLIWTSGATESNNLAIFGSARAARGGHLVTARSEHKAVLDPCRRLEQEGFQGAYLTPCSDGPIAPEQVAAAVRPDTVLVSIMHVNNEIGVLQDIRAISAVCRARAVPLHVDAAQSAGKVPVDVGELGCDLLSFTAHKLYGPKGIWRAVSHAPEWQLFAAAAHLRWRPGARAALRHARRPSNRGLWGRMRARGAAISADTQRWTGCASACARSGGSTACCSTAIRPGALANILVCGFAGVEGESLLMGLPELAPLSTGSACHPEHDELPSYVLRALGRDSEQAQSSLRFSLGRFTREQDVDLALAAVTREVRRLRAALP